MNGRRAEFLFDLFWIVFSGGYCAIALSYPPEGRMVPLTIGSVALAISLLHFSGNFIRLIRPLTHGREDVEGGASIERSEMIAGLWALGLLAGIFLVGAVAAVFVFFLAYFGLAKRRWVLGVFGAVVMTFLTWGLFGKLIGMTLPTGVITPVVLNLF
jgi:hypothetical protein